MRDAISRDAAAVRSEYARRADDDALRRYYARIGPAVERLARERRQRTLALLDRLGPRPQLRVLDLGCGTGADLAYLAAHGFAASRLAGVDLLAAALAEARARVDGATIAIATGAELPFADAAFDATLQTTALSSIVDPDVRARVASELARVTRPRGFIVSYDMRAVVGRNPRLVAIDRAELVRLFGSAGEVTMERHGLDLGIASRLPAPLARVVARAVPALLRSYLAVVARAAPVDARSAIASIYAGYERSGHAERWAGTTRGDALAADERESWMVGALGESARGTVLDVGCGDGNLARTIERRRGRPHGFIGVDLLPDRLAEARARTPWATFAIASADRLPLADASVDAAVASTLFSSLREPWQRAGAAREMGRVVRAGGRIAVYDLRYLSPANRAVRPISLAELRGLFPGWRIADARTLTVLPPLARTAVFGSRPGYAILSRVPPLRSHLGVVLERPA